MTYGEYDYFSDESMINLDDFEMTLITRFFRVVLTAASVGSK